MRRFFKSYDDDEARGQKPLYRNPYLLCTVWMHREEYPCREYTRRNMHTKLLSTALSMPRKHQNEQLQRQHRFQEGLLVQRAVHSTTWTPRWQGPITSKSNPSNPFTSFEHPWSKPYQHRTQIACRHKLQILIQNEFSCENATYTERIRGSVRAFEGCRDLRTSYDLMDEGGTLTLQRIGKYLRNRMLSKVCYHCCRFHSSSVTFFVFRTSKFPFSLQCFTT